MELNRNQWFVRWYFWSLSVVGAFTDNDKSYLTMSGGTNLCSFMRVTLVWAPLVLLCNLVFYVLVLSVLTIAPIVFFGLGIYVSIVIALAIVIAAIVGYRRYQHYLDEQRMLHPEPKAGQVEQEAVAPKPPGFFAVVWSYIVAAKQKICPMITFDHKVEGATS
jgi:hypothetical protein